MHVLFLRFSSLGDIVLTKPLLTLLLERGGEDLKISYLTSKTFLPLLEDFKEKITLYAISRKKGHEGRVELYQVVQKIKKESSIDVIVDLHGSLRSLMVRLLCPLTPHVVMNKQTPERILLTLFKWSPFLKRDLPLSLRYIRDLWPLFFKARPPIFPLPLSLEERQQKEKWIAIVPTAAFEKKRWPPSSFYQFLDLALGHSQLSSYTFFLLAGKDDHFCKIFDDLEQKYPKRFQNLYGKTSLAEVFSLLKECRLCVGNDTGLLHVAESVGTPVITLFGPTVEEFGFAPYRKESKTLSRKQWCRPCSTKGDGGCWYKEPRCFKKIGPQEVLEEVLLLESFTTMR